MRNATKTTVAAFGTLAAVAGVEHGIGEVLQGSVAPQATMILSWPDSEFFGVLGGEPAMTLVPNLLVTGILAILVSLLFLVWAVVFAQRRHDGLVLLLLSVVLLLVGGGFCPPLLGLILAVPASRINAPLAWWRTRLPRGVRRGLATLWPWSFAIAITAWLALFPGTNIAAYYLGVEDAGLVVAVILSAFGTLFLTILAGLARDAERQPDARQSPSTAS